jgi:predicted ATPase
MNASPVVTNWCVITGAPSSGKTSVINVLRDRGFKVQDEAARDIIEEGLAEGKTLAEIRADAKTLQRKILARKIAQEKALNPADLVFMDRGMPDSLSYYRLASMEEGEPRKASAHFRYRAVFLFDRLPLVKDDVRSEDDATADKIDHMLEADYRDIGYVPVRVPVFTVTERADFILKSLGLYQAA